MGRAEINLTNNKPSQTLSNPSGGRGRGPRSAGDGFARTRGHGGPACLKKKICGTEPGIRFDASLPHGGRPGPRSPTGFRIIPMGSPPPPPPPPRAASYHSKTLTFLMEVVASVDARPPPLPHGILPHGDGITGDPDRREALPLRSTSS